MKSIPFLALGVFYLSVVHFVFGAQAILQWNYLSGLPMRMPPAWLIAGHLMWGVIFALTGWGVWGLKAWGRRALLVGSVLYQAHMWANHILFDASDYARQVWPFEACLSLLLIALVWGWLFWPGVRQLYDAKNLNGTQRDPSRPGGRSG